MRRQKAISTACFAVHHDATLPLEWLARGDHLLLQAMKGVHVVGVEAGIGKGGIGEHGVAFELQHVQPAITHEGEAGRAHRADADHIGAGRDVFGDAEGCIGAAAVTPELGVAAGDELQDQQLAITAGQTGGEQQDVQGSAIGMEPAGVSLHGGVAAGQQLLQQVVGVDLVVGLDQLDELPLLQGGRIAAQQFGAGLVSGLNDAVGMEQQHDHRRLQQHLGKALVVSRKCVGGETRLRHGGKGNRQSGKAGSPSGTVRLPIQRGESAGIPLSSKPIGQSTQPSKEFYFSI
jgi:hypothetical protein